MCACALFQGRHTLCNQPRGTHPARRKWKKKRDCGMERARKRARHPLLFFLVLLFFLHLPPHSLSLRRHAARPPPARHPGIQPQHWRIPRPQGRRPAQPVRGIGRVIETNKTRFVAPRRFLFPSHASLSPSHTAPSAPRPPRVVTPSPRNPRAMAHSTMTSGR